MKIHRIDSAAWEAASAATHLAIFGAYVPPSEFRIDFALVVEDDAGHPLGYLTARESSAKLLYWQWGGCFPGTAGTKKVLDVYRAGIDWCRNAGYHRVTTLVKNDNISYLHLAMKVGFRIIGSRVWEEDGKATVLCELSLNLR